MKPCEIVVVLDRSGSMTSIMQATIDGFNAFIGEHQRSGARTWVSLYQFDHEYLVSYEGLPIDSVPRLNAATYRPRGNTALHDAMGRTISTALERITAPTSRSQMARHASQGERDVIVVVITDGLENSSHEYTAEQVRRLVERARDRGWQVIYLGANQDAVLTAAAFGIRRGQTMSFAGNPLATRAVYESVAGSTMAYRGGITANACFTQADRDTQAELGAPRSPQDETPAAPAGPAPAPTAASRGNGA